VDKTLQCDLTYSLKLLNAQDETRSITSLANAKVVFAMNSDDCDIKIAGDLNIGEWVGFFFFYHYFFFLIFIYLLWFFRVLNHKLFIIPLL